MGNEERGGFDVCDGGASTPSRTQVVERSEWRQEWKGSN